MREEPRVQSRIKSEMSTNHQSKINRYLSSHHAKLARRVMGRDVYRRCMVWLQETECINHHKPSDSDLGSRCMYTAAVYQLQYCWGLTRALTRWRELRENCVGKTKGLDKGKAKETPG